MKVIEILEQIENEISNYEEDEEEKAYIAAEQEGKQLDNELISINGRVKNET